jgi:tetratricopeptide (TPR) repeat protein
MSLFDPTIDAAFREYADLEFRCHHLLLGGKDDAPETSAAEDRREELWEKLDDVQRRSLSGMGSDLNWVRRNGEPPPKGRKAPEEVTPIEQQDLVAAIGRKDWHRVLHYLRLCAPMFPIATLAHLRGSAYDAIGLPKYASVFYGQGLEVDPGNDDIGLAALSSLEKTDPTNAVQLAKKIIASPLSYPPVVLTLAAVMILRSVESKDGPIDRQLISALLNGAVKRLQLEPSVEARLRAYEMAAFGFEIIGDLSAALRCLDEGLALSPNSDSLLVDKGLLLYGSQTEQAVAVFDQLTRRGTPNVWPYVYLTHFNLLKRNFGVALEMTREAWARATDDSVRAQLLEWQAICQTELHYPPEVVRPIFEKAISLDPSNSCIAKNLAAFDEAMGAAKDSEWQFEEEASVKALRAHITRKLELIEVT